MKGRCVVTGACGFIGSHMVELLADSGFEVVATDLQSALDANSGIAKYNVEVVKTKAKEIVPADISEPNALDKIVEGADYVFHVASVFSYSATWEVLEKVNVKGMRNLIDSIAKLDKKPQRLVVWGAGGVYGKPKPDRIPFREDMAPDPPNNYLRSKWFQEFLVMEHCPRLGIPYTIIRPTTVFGTRQIYGFPEILKNAYHSAIVMVPANFTGRIPFVSVEDVVNSALFLAQTESAKDQVFNVNDDSQMTTVDLFRFFAAVFGKPFVKLPAIPIPPIQSALKIAADIIGVVAKRKGMKPIIERDTVEYLGADFVYSNEKLKSVGYKFIYPDPKVPLVKMAQWYVDNNLL